MRNSLSDAHPFSKLIFSLFIMLASFLLIILSGILIAIPIFHIDISNLSAELSNYTDPAKLPFLKYLQTIQAIGLFIIPAFIIGYLFNSKSIQYLKLNIIPSMLTVILSILILSFSIPIINYLAVLNNSMQFPESLSGIENWMKEKENSAKVLTEFFMKMDSKTSLFFNLFMIGLLPAVGEELIFRGVFQRIFAEWTKNIHVGIVIAACLFSAMHFQFYGFLPRMILGVLLGYLFFWSGSIWVPILGHFVNNALAVTLYYFFSDRINSKIDSFGANEDSYKYLALSIVLVFVLLFYFYHENKSLKNIKNP